MYLTKFDQILIIKLLDSPLTFRTQKVFRNKVSFYKSIWKLRDKGLVYSKEIEVNGRISKEWYLTADGILFARILRKGLNVENRNKRK
jgi:hypothetical protein